MNSAESQAWQDRLLEIEQAANWAVPCPRKWWHDVLNG